MPRFFLAIRIDHRLMQSPHDNESGKLTQAQSAAYNRSPLHTTYETPMAEKKRIGRLPRDAIRMLEQRKYK
jgi:hypothetical protein